MCVCVIPVPGSPSHTALLHMWRTSAKWRKEAQKLQSLHQPGLLPHLMPLLLLQLWFEILPLSCCQGELGHTAVLYREGHQPAGQYQNITTCCSWKYSFRVRNKCSLIVYLSGGKSKEPWPDRAEETWGRADQGGFAAASSYHTGFKGPTSCNSSCRRGKGSGSHSLWPWERTHGASDRVREKSKKWPRHVGAKGFWPQDPHSGSTAR